MAEVYDYEQFKKRDQRIAKTRQAIKDASGQSQEAFNRLATGITNPIQISQSVKAYNDNLLKETERSNTPVKPLIFKSDEELAFDKAREDLGLDINFIETDELVLPGEFKFNDQKLKISPEQISIMVDEYENSLLLMREDTPVSAQSGRKRIRIIVNFPVDIANGWSQLAKIVTQIKKTPIATIENEKIRKELFGELKDTVNIGVVVDNLNGYVEEDYPTLLRCTLQMSWFNHAPYVEDLMYLEDYDGVVKKQKSPSKRYEKFYMEGTSNQFGVMNNDPSLIPDPESLILMYKEYKEFGDAVSLSKPDERSALSSNIKGGNQETFEFQKQLEAEGWYLAEEDQAKLGSVVEGVFYRWRKFEIPFTDLDSSGALILQNVSFSLNTNPSYISMEKYSVPTVQFLGGSVSDIRAIVFAAGEHASSQDKTPVGTSNRLSELQAIIKRVSEDRIRYSKFNKENHMLLSHPISKLLKYKTLGNTSQKLFYQELKGKDEKGKDEFEALPFTLDYFLPVIVSSNNSTTIPGLPFASKLQLDFKETRLAQNNRYLTYSGTSGSSSNKDAKFLLREIMFQFYNDFSIYFDEKSQAFSRQLVYDLNPVLAAKAMLLIEALNSLRYFDKSVFNLDTAFNSEVFKANNQRAALIDDGEENLTISEIKNRRGRGVATQSIKDIFRPDWIEQFVLALYVDYSKALFNGEEWVQPYIDLFQEYTKSGAEEYKDLYPDMMLPKNQVNPSFYFADNEAKNKYFKSNILRNMPGNYQVVEDQLKRQILNEDYIKNLPNGQFLKPSRIKGFAPAYNHAALNKNNKKGAQRVHVHNDPNFRVMATQQAIAEASPPTYSLAQVYPTFQVQLFTPTYDRYQELSSEDLTMKELNSENQFDLLDVFDLSSILDIRIIKDEYEAADVMVIRVLNTYKTLMTKQGKDPTYNHKTFNIKDLVPHFENGSLKGGKILDGVTTASVVNSNLEDIGIKEGVRIRAQLGNSNWVDELGVEFQGRIASVNGKDIIEIYCVSDGHELIQNTTGYKGEEKDREYTFNSETTDLIGDLLATTDEIKSFGNTKFEILGNIGLSLPTFMGGVSALDNIYAPKLQAPFSWGELFTDGLSKSLSTYSIVYGIGGVVGGIAATTAFFGGLGLPILGAAAVGGLWSAFNAIGNKMNPAQFTVYQQTVWDVLQELTLRHPGYICAIVPFDNRSTIYFGEPDGTYFHRGVRSAAEKAMKASAAKSGIFLESRATQREIYDKTNSIFKNNPVVVESNYPFLSTNAKTRQDAFNKLVNGSNTQLELLSLAAMQKSFRNYHLITSENDIISNDIQASAMGVANSIQVYHPDKNGDANFDGATWFSDYSLTDKMKADDDLHSNLVNNKVFTFHNAHNTTKELELPQKYAVAVLCKELENIYKGKITILGRKGIKPHDIVILSDTHNKISGPVKVGRVIQQLSPQSGWVTHIYPKFIAIPNTSAGSFQMKAVLKAARFWLGTHTDLFYSNMQKFIPDEVADSGKQIRELIQAYEMGVNSPTYLTEEEMTKGLLEREGEVSVISKVGTVGAAAVDASVFAGGQILGNKVTNFDKAGRLQRVAAVQSAKVFEEGKKTVTAVKAAVNTKQVVAPLAQAGKSALAVGKIAGKTLFSTTIGFAGGFLAEYLLNSAIDGIISYMKYREPISIFPLTKDGKPWMAALNGYKENSVIEHLEEQATIAADKMGMTSYLVQKLFKEWTGDVPPKIGYGGDFDVESVIDGDTLHVKNGSQTEKIRILGFDTGELPEGNKNMKLEEATTYEQKMGVLAREELNKLIKENKNQVNISRHGNDNYQRTLGKVSINGVDLSEYMRNNYLAMNYPSGAPKDYSKNLPTHLKNNSAAIAEEKEKAWRSLYEKHMKLKQSQGNR